MLIKRINERMVKIRRENVRDVQKSKDREGGEARERERKVIKSER